MTMSYSPPRESKIEKAGSDYAERRGWFEFKIMAASKNGIPDRFYARRGRCVFVEWKREKKEPSSRQLRRHREMRAAGLEVHVIDTIEGAYELFE